MIYFSVRYVSSHTFVEHRLSDRVACTDDVDAVCYVTVVISLTALFECALFNILTVCVCV